MSKEIKSIKQFSEVLNTIKSVKELSGWPSLIIHR